MSASPMNRRKAGSVVSLLALTVAMASLNGGAALADMPLFTYGDLGGAFALGTGFGTFYAPQANWGTGTVKSSPPNQRLATDPACGRRLLEARVEADLSQR